MWKDLTMSEKAALIKLGVDNGVTNLSDIRDSYNTYAGGGPIKKNTTVSSDLSSLVNEGLKVPSLNETNIGPIIKEESGVIEAPSKPSIAPTEQWVNPNTTNTPTRTAFNNYLESPVVKKRLRKMYATTAAENAMTADEYSDMILQDMKQANANARIVRGSTTQANIGKGIITMGEEVAPGLSNARSGSLSHEIGHLMYPSGDDAWGLKNVNASFVRAKNVYKGEEDTNYDAALEHDNDIREKIPFIYETREDMRKLGIWDYTSGEDITTEQYQKYKDSHPQNRLGNYTDDNNAINLLNTIAYNYAQQDDYITPNITASGGFLNRYKNGGPIRNYKDWSSKLSSYWGEDINKHDYDYEKYYNDNPEEAYEQLNSILNGGHGHFPDGGTSGTYKKLSHPTYPDLGEESWSNNDTIFHLSERQAFGDSDKILDYLGSDLNYNRGGTKVMYKDGYMLPTITVTPKGSSTKLVPNKFHTGYVYSDSPSRAYKYGGYKPSSSIKKRISNWEGSSMKTNRSFEAEARDFNASLPKGATSKLSQEQLDGLYSYSYNVGAGNFRKRVNPILTRYLAGQATIQDVQRSMWASKDNQLRGLAKRRNAERAMLGNYTPMDFGPLSDTTTMMINHYLPQTEPIGIPQLHFNDATDTSKPIELESSTSYSSSDIDFSDPGSSLADTLNMIQMIRRPRKINIYT